MKIAFIGTHGVGKTTLSFELAARLKRMDYSVDLVKEVARDCPLPINRETSYESQSWILHTQIARELASSDRHEAVVCDRSVLDNYAYLVHRVGRRPEFDPVIASWLPTYRLLVKVPLWRAPSFDGVRDVGEAFQREVDALIEALVLDFGAPVLALRTDRAGSWIQDVILALDLPPRPEQVPLFPREP